MNERVSRLKLCLIKSPSQAANQNIIKQNIAEEFNEESKKQTVTKIYRIISR